MSQNPLSQFVVNQLVPEGSQSGRAYQVTESSVSPTRIVGYNEDGSEIEETICALAKSAQFVDRDGNICTVALRTGRIYSEEPEATRYEQVITGDLIRQGQLPLAACPYTTSYQHFRKGPLVDLPIVAAKKALNAAIDSVRELEASLKTKLTAKSRAQAEADLEAAKAAVVAADAAVGEAAHIGDCGGREGAQKLEDACPHMQAIVGARRARAVARCKDNDAKMQAMKASDVAAMIETMGKSFGASVVTSMAGARDNLRDGKGEDLTKA